MTSMLSKQIRSELSQLRRGTLDVTSPPLLASVSAKVLISELRRTFPFVFQRRQIGHKLEIGLAAKINFELKMDSDDEPLFSNAQVQPLLSNCFLISAYDDEIAEMTWATKVRVRPMDKLCQELGISFDSGFKFDRTIDGWKLTPLNHRETVLKEAFLLGRGWQLPVVRPISLLSGAP